MPDLPLKAMTNEAVAAHLKDLQRRFDAGPPAQELLAIIAAHKAAYDELLSRGLTEVQIEWMIHDRALA